MKIKVNRQLSGGSYYVSFAATDFTPDELKKMESFGVPTIDLVVSAQPNAHQAVRVQLTKISPNFRAVFQVEQQAKDYETRVLNQIGAAMKRLRERTDDFTSTQEVEF